MFKSRTRTTVNNKSTNVNFSNAKRKALIEQNRFSDKFTIKNNKELDFDTETEEEFETDESGPTLETAPRVGPNPADEIKKLNEDFGGIADPENVIDKKLKSPKILQSQSQSEQDDQAEDDFTREDIEQDFMGLEDSQTVPHGSEEYQDDMKIYTRQDFLAALTKVPELQRRGYYPPVTFDLNSNPEDVILWVEACEKLEKKKRGVALAKKFLINTIGIVEWANETYDPFGADLTGWQADVESDIDSFEDVLGRIVERYLPHLQEFNPIIELLFLLAASGYARHNMNTNMKKYMPKQQAPRYNPNPNHPNPPSPRPIPSPKPPKPSIPSIPPLPNMDDLPDLTTLGNDNGKSLNL